MSGKIITTIDDTKGNFLSYFFRVESGKNVLDPFQVLKFSTFVVSLFIFFEAVSARDSSFYTQGKVSEVKEEAFLGDNDSLYGGMTSKFFKSRSTRKFKKVTPKFKANQIIEGNYSTKNKEKKRKSRTIGKLLIEFDSRAISDQVYVELPYGLKVDGNQIAISGSSIIGKVSRVSKKRIYLKFHTLLKSNGEEIKITGHALDSKDYRRGIRAKFHSKAVSRITNTVLLGAATSAVGGIISRESSREVESTQKSIERELKMNGLQGVSQGLTSEIQTLAQGVDSSNRDYLSLGFGKDLIIEITAIGEQRGGL